MPDIEAIHPPADRLAAYALGEMDGPEMDEIEQHLSSCDSCCQVIKNQPGDSLVWKLRAQSAWTSAGTTVDGVPAVESRASFQVPSSFVLHPQGQEAVASPSCDPRVLAGIPKELNYHPRYRIVAVIGAGGKGAVYRAEHRLMDRPVALKVMRGGLLGDEAMVERFRREVKSAARLPSHPNVVAAYDAEQAGETHVLIMEFVEGTDLARLVDRRGPLPVGEACEYARQAALGLQHGFEHGMVHRDIKPQNLMRTTRGQIKILDFGLARFASEVGSHAGVTAEGMILGSADYIAPEQIDDPHAADIRADIYGLGCTLYFLLTGGPPFPDGGVIQKLLAHREKTPRPLAECRADVPPEVALVVEQMMAKDPAGRFQTPDGVVTALAPYADAARHAATDLVESAGADAPTMPVASPSLVPTVGDPRTAQPATRPRPSLRRPWVRIAAAVAVMAAGVGSMALFTYRIETPRGELVIETDDPSIDVIVKQGGKQVTIVDPKTSDRIELHAGQYELQLAGGGEGMKLSTDSFTLKRGDKTVVTVRREAPKAAPPFTPITDLLAGAGTEEVGEIARFQCANDHVHMAYLLPDSRHVLYSPGGGYENDKWVESKDPALWVGDLAAPKNPRRITVSAPAGFSFAVARDGKLGLTASSDGALRLWDLETGKSRRIRRDEPTIGPIGPVAFSPDERHAAYVRGDTIRLCDLKTGGEMMTFLGHSGRIWTFAFCPDGRRLVSGGVDDHSIRVWNVEKGEEIRQMKHGHGVTGVAVLPDGRRAVTGSWDRTIGDWDLETGQQLRRISGIPDKWGTPVAVSPDGRRALFGTHFGHTVWLWDLDTGEEIERWEGHTNQIRHVAFAPDGRRAVSTSFDKSARVWALPHGRPPGEEPPVAEVANFLGHDGVG